MGRREGRQGSCRAARPPGRTWLLPREKWKGCQQGGESATVVTAPGALLCPPKTPCFWRRLGAGLSGLCLRGSNPSPSTYQLGASLFNFSVPPSPHQKNGADKNISFRGAMGGGERNSCNLNNKDLI
uniref:Uncharacterized protein n=1 Tax=Myotis myotis TaxID=51298 RepID=A0A7J7XHQ7_MYOMY|nr:hypothetical protein mMyoMyo1_011750 [Myotis myotis]